MVNRSFFDQILASHDLRGMQPLPNRLSTDRLTAIVGNFRRTGRNREASVPERTGHFLLKCLKALQHGGCSDG